MKLSDLLDALARSIACWGYAGIVVTVLALGALR